MRNENLYIFTYATVVCILCSVLLSLAATGLSERQEENKKVDRQKNMMLAMKLVDRTASKDAVIKAYSESIESVVLDLEGKIIPDLKPEQLKDADKDKKLPLYIRKKDGQVVSYAFPIEGKGLWSTLLGFMSLKADANTVEGLTFYQHGETAGLGAEIAEAWFQDSFVGKKTLDASGNIYSVIVAKGKAVSSPTPIEHTVDGISGSTITGNGVTALVKKALVAYEPYFKVQRGGKS